MAVTKAKSTEEYNNLGRSFVFTATGGVGKDVPPPEDNNLVEENPNLPGPFTSPYLRGENNLSDLQDVDAARENLGITQPEDTVWLSPDALGFIDELPADPADGDRYIILPDSADPLDDKAHNIVDRVNGEWVYADPAVGSAIIVQNDTPTIYVRSATGWDDGAITSIQGTPVGTEIQAPAAFTTVVATVGVYSPVFYHRQTPNSTNGNVDALLSSYTLTRFTGTSPVLRGIIPPPTTVSPATWRGVHMFIRCDTATGMTIAHQSNAVTSGRRIISPTGEDLRLEQGEIVILVLSTSGPPDDWRWLIETVPASWIRKMPRRVVAIADGASITVDPSTTDIAKVGPLTTDRTVTISDGAREGQLLTVQISQDGTGGHTPTLAGKFRYSDELADISGIVETASYMSELLFKWNATMDAWMLMALSNYAPAA
jgi:hypothetical protein